MAEETKFYDVIILGSGPAGLQAAIHAARKKASVLLLGRPENSGIVYADDLENFMGITTISGTELLRVGRKQAAHFGAELLEEDVLKVDRDGAFFSLKTESDRTFMSAALILAMGTTRTKLGVRGESDLLGRGISYCVECDATFFQDEDVIIVGNGSAAADGVLTMLKYAKTVHLISEKLLVADALREELEKSDALLHEGAKVKEILGKDRVEGVLLEDGTTVSARGVFIELGAKGIMELAATLDIALDYDMKYIEVNRKQETSVEGLYAAGDICGLPLQVAKAVGEGCIAGLEAVAYARRKARELKAAQQSEEVSEETKDADSEASAVPKLTLEI